MGIFFVVHVTQLSQFAYSAFLVLKYPLRCIQLNSFEVSCFCLPTRTGDSRDALYIL
jgi:hypothetical protein